MAIITERFLWKSPDFWQKKHPDFNAHAPGLKFRRHLKSGSRSFRFICREEDVKKLRKAGYLVRIETISCYQKHRPLNFCSLTFWTTNAASGVEVA